MEKRTRMTKYRRAKERIDYSYDYWIDVLESKEIESFLHHVAQLNAIQLLASDDLEISEEDFDEINAWSINRRKHDGNKACE